MTDRRFIFHDIRLAARLAWYDLLSEKILALCLIIGLAATAAPLIILSGLRGGLVEGLRTVLLEDPHVREISSASNRDFTTGWLDRLRKEPDVVFVMPRTRTLAASVLLVPPGRPFAGRRIELIPSHADDPLTTPATMPADESTILLSASAAASLHIQAGDLLELHVTRLGLGPETVRIPLHVQAITPQRALNRDAAFVSLRLAQTVELYREHSLSWSDAWAQAATPAPSYPGFRLYTRQINTIPALDTRLRAAGVDISDRAQDVSDLLLLDQRLTVLFRLTALLGVTGFFASLTAALWANVERKQLSLATLRFLGVQRLTIFPVIQAQILALTGIFLALTGALIVGSAINHVFAETLPPGHTLCRIGAGLWLETCLITALGAFLAALAAARSLRRIDPWEGVSTP
ncbi:hypothetical protein HKD28_10615 [Gluconobacter sp. LMG 1744]|uniref:hypothetical protein n=1 Tax=Gluconobacter TaxID=441 RepID=UPI0018852D7E|nr:MULTISPECIES: hypothetical protein [Gluconobacter]MBF0891853.1 hypothetical protein [Gluconobacter cadivus]MBS1092466.1 hypothetical protein [Gluconobacter sp. Dm-74]